MKVILKDTKTCTPSWRITPRLSSQTRAATRKFGFTPFLPSFAQFCQVLPSFTDFWTYSKAPPFASKNTEFWKKSVYRLIVSIPTTVAALSQTLGLAGVAYANFAPLTELILKDTWKLLITKQKHSDAYRGLPGPRHHPAGRSRSYTTCCLAVLDQYIYLARPLLLSLSTANKNRGH